MQSVANFGGLKIRSLLVALAFFVPFVSHAGTISFSPSRPVVSPGDTVSVTLYVKSPSEAVNAVAGELSFPEDLLEMSSVSKSGSIFSLWVQEPSFSNSNGSANFEGVILNPGFTGSSGKLVTFIFRAKKIGTATISLASGSVLANDGSGTNVLTNAPTANIKIETKIVSDDDEGEYVSDEGRLVIKEKVRDDLTEPNVEFSVKFEGDIGLVASYEIEIDDEDVDTMESDNEFIYTTKKLAPGEHRLFIKAIDEEGMSLASGYKEFEVKPIESPIVTYYDNDVSKGEVFVLQGISPSAGKVVVLFDDMNGKTFEKIVETNVDGNFIFETKISKWVDQFSIRLTAIDERGAQSNKTGPLVVDVSPKDLITRVGSGWWVIVNILILLINALFAMKSLLRFCRRHGLYHSN